MTEVATLEDKIDALSARAAALDARLDALVQQIESHRASKRLESVLRRLSARIDMDQVIEDLLRVKAFAFRDEDFEQCTLGRLRHMVCYAAEAEPDNLVLQRARTALLELHESKTNTSEALDDMCIFQI